MRLIDPTKTRTRIEKGRGGRVVKHRDHHNGSVDGKVFLQALHVKLTTSEGAPLNVEQVKAIGAWEEANRAYLVAKHSGNAAWRNAARAQLDASKRRLEDNQ